MFASFAIPAWPQACFVDCDRGFEEFDKEEELGLVALGESWGIGIR